LSFVIDSYTAGYDSDTAIVNSGGRSQSFLCDGSYDAETLKFNIHRSFGATGNITGRIYAHSGSLGSSSVPTGDALVESTAIDITTTTYPDTSWITFTFATPYELSTDTNYCLVIWYEGTGTLYVHRDASSPTHAGNYAYSSAPWSYDAAKDLLFELIGDNTVATSTTTVEHSDNDALIGTNPYRGPMHFGNASTNDYDFTLVAAYISWKDLEPTRLTFDWSSFETEFKFSTWRTAGYKMMIMFYMDWSKSPKIHTDIQVAIIKPKTLQPAIYLANEGDLRYIVGKIEVK